MAAIGAAAALALALIHDRAVAEAPGNVPMIKAETTPLKVKPSDPGGLKVPHKDISIYERLETHRKVVPAGDPGKGTKKPPQLANAKNDPKSGAQAIGPYRIQLGAFSSNEVAQKRWNELKGRHESLLGSLQMVLERVEVRGKGASVRLQAGPLKSAAEVQKLCGALAKQKVSCLLVKS